MELKVWVEGVARVVCGLSMNTSCQDVVIALAKSLGQTGRYILLVKRPGQERQLLPGDRPLQHLSRLGAPEVRFVLRRTGPSRGGGGAGAAPGSPARPKRTKPSRARSPSPGAPDPDPLSGPKEEAFRQVLQQHGRLQDLQAQLRALQREAEVWERPAHLAAGPARVSEGALEALRALEALGDQEGGPGGPAGPGAAAEAQRGRPDAAPSQLRSSTEAHGRRIQELHARAAQLEQELQQAEEEAPRPLEEALQQRQADDLQEALSGTQRDLRRREEKLQGGREEVEEVEEVEELEELDRELRQCKLQLFILQSGGPPRTAASARRSRSAVRHHMVEQGDAA
ncbi:Ras association domain-containing protein 7 [Liparis tanakae]|uniref:Ras association domain-containing protein 7 n=1 Tax=Liparis tanakae TaxID=230148 RepID=A0A4Z2E9X4_9TELE|nr:Ras association domain-containing protein 7 [Liparis tanakae]